MKRSIRFVSAISASCLFLLVSCDSKDYKENSITTDNSDPSQRIMSDTSTVMNNENTTVMSNDHTTMMSSDTSTTASMQDQGATAKTRKGKVSTVMMTSSNKTAPMNQDKQGYYSSVEVLPAFPGGQKALDNFVFKNLEYPADAVDNSVEGVVTVNFAVDESGKVSNAKVVGKPMGYGMEEEVLKAISKMPTWTPGVIKGKNVKTYYTLPVNFKLEQ